MSDIIITKPEFRWLFGGVGFHNSEATMTPIMSEKFKNETIYKTFHEISPTYSRVFAGYADWTREAMDAFADYYDKTFREAGTLLYLVPGRMPYITKDFDMEEYCERVASNIEYLVKERRCTKIRHYCVTNELSVGNTYAYLSDHLDLFGELHDCLYRAFKRHGLDIGLLATDCSGVERFDQIKWASENIDEITDTYCAHLYTFDIHPGDLDAYRYYLESFSGPVLWARERHKRFILGEFGINSKTKWINPVPMLNDTCYGQEFPEKQGLYAMGICEMAMAAINCGCLAAVFWTMFDYPDPFIRENGDSPKEKARYDVARFSGAGIEMRYNKNGLVRWCDDEKDYTSRASLYTMGYLAKLFRKGSRVLEVKIPADNTLRCSAITNPDGSCSVAIINWECKAKTLTVSLEHNLKKPMRVYRFSSENVPYSRFNDLQPHSDVISDKDGIITVEIGASSMIFLTTDYIDRVPSKIEGVRISGERLIWEPCKDEEHCYYRVFASKENDFRPSAENQIASTVAEEVEICDNGLYYKVCSVDKYGNMCVEG